VAATAIQRLLRVLDLEEKQGWRNRAVIGGLRAMSERWQQDAQQEQVDARIVKAVTVLMADYDSANSGDRPLLVASMRRALAGDLESPDVAVEAEVEPVVETVLAEPEETKAVVEAAPPEPKPAPPARERNRRSATPHRSPHDLQAAPSILPGVGSATAEQLARLGIERVVDLLWHLPVRHEDYSQLRTIAQVQPGEQVTIVANLWDVRERKLSRNRQMVQGILGDGTGTLTATWWSKYVAKQLKPGTTMRFSGKVDLYMGRKTLDSPIFEDVDDEMVATGRLAPVYPLTEGLTHKKVRSLIRYVLDEYSHYLSDPLPTTICADYQLMDLAAALRQAHFPDSPELLQAAIRRLSFEELFYLQLGVLQRRRELRQATAPAFPDGEALLDQFQALLPFALTHAQQRVLHEVVQDLERTTPMTRLVQGDVGSGKTAVAAGAMFVAAAHGAQSALLAPTQILAEQHYRGIGGLLTDVARPDGSPLRVALLTGRVVGEERETILAGMASGEIDIVVGTTALIQEGVDFANLGFVVVDEQHRFGVEQRGALRTKGGQQPHLLVMSATPIPRSLALTLYGDLDVSVIDEMPPGRMPIKSYVIYPRTRERMYDYLRRQAREGRQSYIVYPLVEESEKLTAGAAVDEFERLRHDVFPDLRLGLLHGRMSGGEKDTVMSAFAAGDFDVLVSTTVIEVGIDVPNATMMVVEDAERFGLAQLHQLRGRVGRGQHESMCVLVTKVEQGEARERLRILEQTTNGFVLAEKDLELRGPGDFLGTRQSGLPDLRVAQFGDLVTIGIAREAAQRLFATDPLLNNYPQLARQVQHFWRGHGDVN
jgi:ATP-dependent DNA helicase RecG